MPTYKNACCDDSRQAPFHNVFYCIQSQHNYSDCPINGVN